MRLGSDIAVTVVLASSYSSNWLLAWEPPYAVGVALNRPKKKRTQVSFLFHILEAALKRQKNKIKKFRLIKISYHKKKKKIKSEV